MASRMEGQKLTGNKNVGRQLRTKHREFGNAAEGLSLWRDGGRLGKTELMVRRENTGEGTVDTGKK